MGIPHTFGPPSPHVSAYDEAYEQARIIYPSPRQDFSEPTPSITVHTPSPSHPDSYSMTMSNGDDILPPGRDDPESHICFRCGTYLCCAKTFPEEHVKNSCQRSGGRLKRDFEVQGHSSGSRNFNLNPSFRRFRQNFIYILEPRNLGEKNHDTKGRYYNIYYRFENSAFLKQFIEKIKNRTSSQPLTKVEEEENRRLALCKRCDAKRYRFLRKLEETEMKEPPPKSIGRPFQPPNVILNPTPKRPAPETDEQSSRKRHYLDIVQGSDSRPKLKFDKNSPLAPFNHLDQYPRLAFSELLPGDLSRSANTSPVENVITSYFDAKLPRMRVSRSMSPQHNENVLPPIKTPSELEQEDRYASQLPSFSAVLREIGHRIEIYNIRNTVDGIKAIPELHTEDPILEISVNAQSTITFGDLERRIEMDNCLRQSKYRLRIGDGTNWFLSSDEVRSIFGRTTRITLYAGINDRIHSFL